MLDRRLGGVGLRESLPPIGKMILATAVMWVACVGVQYLPFYPGGAGKLVWAVQLLILMTTGGVVYFGVSAALGLVAPVRLLQRN